MHMVFKKLISTEGYKMTMSLLSVSPLGVDIINNFLHVLPDILMHLKYMLFSFLHVTYVNM